MSECDGHRLEVEDLRTYFRTDDGLVRAVDGVSFHIDAGETFALVGESGCGKSVTAFSILGLVPRPPGQIAGGTVRLEGQNLLELNEKQMRAVRGRQISMIFQEPMTSLNPVYTAGSQVAEAIRLHRGASSGEARRQTIDLLARVGIPAPEQRYDAYPHQLSGGMRQRVMIAMALSCDPSLLIADEPTTALDVTIQEQILQLLRDIQTGGDLGILMITHDLAVVAENARRVAVMYAGKIVEQAETGELFTNPLHPYTRGLMRSIPRLGDRRERLDTIPGSVPNPLNFPTGCPFHPRCELTRRRAESADRPVVAIDAGDRVLRRCAECTPELRETAPGHGVACWEAEGYQKTTDEQQAH